MSASSTPLVMVVMGVSGSGKTTVSRLLATQLGWEFADADAFHPDANLKKMSQGIPLDDEDRWPWLAAIARWIDTVRRDGRHGIVACSALKRAYRELLLHRRPDVRLVYLKAELELVKRRMARRRDHFMPVALLQSQFDALEEPQPDEDPIVVGVDAPPEAIVQQILQTLSGLPAHPP